MASLLEYSWVKARQMSQRPRQRGPLVLLAGLRHPGNRPGMSIAEGSGIVSRLGSCHSRTPGGPPGDDIVVGQRVPAAGTVFQRGQHRLSGRKAGACQVWHPGRPAPGT